MTFPEKKFASVADYAVAYFDQAKAATASVDAEKLEAALKCLDAAYERGGTVYVCGNGGSASISNHLACDHSKGGQTDTDLRPKVVSLSTNMELITAIANDITYDDIFIYQLRTLAEDGDVLLTISSSGDSKISSAPLGGRRKRASTSLPSPVSTAAGRPSWRRSTCMWKAIITASSRTPTNP
jgi:phosphoheptose isomerase